MTPHNIAKKDQIAKVVLMPGDPLRAKFIAENYLENYELVNDVRGMLAYTGTYKNKKITIMGHGMGIPSIGIYSYELFNFYDVDTIIRIGSCGSFLSEINLGDIIVAENAISDSTYAYNIGLDLNSKVIGCDSNLHEIVIKILDEKKYKYYDGYVFSSDAFYGVRNSNEIDLMIEQNKLLGVEMEAFALYANAKKLNKKAITLLTVSDSIVNKCEMGADERRTSFKKMMEVALELAIEIYE